MFNLRKQELAASATQRRLASGEIIKPNTCERCPRKKNLSAHHPNYDIAKLIVWLCLKCHREAHKEDAIQERKRRKELLKMRLGNVNHLVNMTG